MILGVGDVDQIAGLGEALRLAKARARIRAVERAREAAADHVANVPIGTDDHDAMVRRVAHRETTVGEPDHLAGRCQWPVVVVLRAQAGDRPTIERVLAIAFRECRGTSASERNQIGSPLPLHTTRPWTSRTYTLGHA